MLNHFFSVARLAKPLGLILCIGFVAGITSSCDRPFIPPRLPEVDVIEPNPNTIFIRQSVIVRATASSFREISHLEIDGSRMYFDEENREWVDTLLLDPGINDIEITAFDVQQVAGGTTIQLTFLRPALSNDAPVLPAPWRLGGHTATLLGDYSVLVTGGSSASTGAAFRAAFLLPDGASEFVLLDAELAEARIGHSASLLPDGRVLILGGSTDGALASVTQLVRSAEIYDPATQRFTTLTLQGTPLEREDHVTFVSEGASGYLIDVFGGTGRIDSRSNLLGIRRDFRTFILRQDTLRSLGADGELLTEIEAARGITAVQVNSPLAGEAGRFVVSGSNFLETAREDVNFTIDFNSAPVRIELLPRHVVPRTQHAAVTLQPGLVAYFGGFQGFDASALGSSEVYLESAGNFFTLDHVLSIERRFDHTATKLRSERILLLGGFSPNGQARSTSQYVDWKAIP